MSISFDEPPVAEVPAQPQPPVDACSAIPAQVHESPDFSMERLSAQARQDQVPRSLARYVARLEAQKAELIGRTEKITQAIARATEAMPIYEDKASNN